MKETKFKDTEIGRIPEEWETLYIHQITEISTGATPSTNINEYWENGTIRWMSSGELNNKIIYDVNGRITQKGYDNTGTHMLPKNCVLIGLAGQGKTRGTAAYNKVELCTNQSIAAILPNSKYESKYLYFYIDSLYDKLRLLSAGDGGRGGLNKQILQNLEIAMPPLNEQHHIASALTSIDNLIASLGKMIEKKKNIKQGAMQQLLTGQIRLKGFSEPWVKRKLGDNATIQRGGSPRPIEAYLTTNRDGINWIKIGDVRPNDKFIRHTAEKIIPEGISHSRQVYKGDFILSNSMSFGRPYILDIDGCIHDGWLVIKDYSNTYDMDFLYYILSSNAIFEQYIAMAAGSSVKNLNKEKVANVILFAPQSLAEQRAIATILTKMDNEITALEAKRAKYEAIKQGMMQQLLTGKIRLIS